MRSSTICNGTGNAPARSSADSELVSAAVKLPEICPEPPTIGSWMTGALITLPSSTMANCRPTLSMVIFANCLAPASSKRNDTTGRPVVLSSPLFAWTSRSP